MFYHLANLGDTIIYRSMSVLLVSIIISFILGYFFISYMNRRQYGEKIRANGPRRHMQKKGTPTMGGIFILASLLITLFCMADIFSWPMMILLFIVCSFFLLGLLDDLSKLLKKNSKGIAARTKFFWQFAIAGVVSFFMVKWDLVSTTINLPFSRESLFDLGDFYFLFSSLVIVGTSNAVNLTDGLDGLAIFPIMTTAFTLGLMALFSSSEKLSSLVGIAHIENLEELFIFSLALIGCGLSFLWFNFYPAKIFMGDAGSLSIGSGLGVLAVLTKHEILLFFIGGIFVAEVLSVIIQVLSVRIRKKRIFRMAPFHHHFELLGWSEPTIVIRFWIINGLFTISSLAIFLMMESTYEKI